MLLELESRDNNLIVRLEGELDHHSSESARQKIDRRFLEENLNNIVLDLRKLTFMDSSGIGLVMGRYKKAMERHGELVIVNDNEYIDKILNMSGLLKIVELYSTLDKAMEKL